MEPEPTVLCTNWTFDVLEREFTCLYDGRDLIKSVVLEDSFRSIPWPALARHFKCSVMPLSHLSRHAYAEAASVLGTNNQDDASCHTRAAENVWWYSIILPDKDRGSRITN